MVGMESSAVTRLGHQADVPHDRYSPRGEIADRLCHGDTAFQFDTMGWRLFQKTAGVFKGLGRAGLEGTKWHVRHEQGSLASAPRCAGVVQHLLHGNGHGGFVPEHNLGKGVAHQDDVDTRPVGVKGAGVIIGCDHYYGVAALHLLDSVNCDLVSHN